MASSAQGAAYTHDSLRTEGFIHASFAQGVHESARLYFAPNASLWVLKIDPRHLQKILRVEETPRGPMPHLFGPILADAIVAVTRLEAGLQLEDVIPA
jgi:uncharacterized protein (DUF952 family)